MKQLTGCIITELTLSVIHSSSFDNNRDISTRTHGNSCTRYIYAENFGILRFKTEPVINLFNIPMFKLNNHINLFCKFNRTHTEKSSCIDNTNTSYFNKVTDIIRCRAYKCTRRNLTDFDSIVSDKSVASLDKFKSRFALTYAAVTEDKHTLTVNFYKNTVTGNTRCKLNTKERYKCRHTA